MTIDFDREVQLDEVEQREKQRREQERHENVAGAARAAAGVARHLEVTQDFGDEDVPSVASPIGALLQTGQSLEAGLASDSVDERMARFPELRDVEVSTGIAARFPELAGDGKPSEPDREDEEHFTR